MSQIDSNLYLMPQMVLVAFALLTPALDILTGRGAKSLLGVWSLIGLLMALLMTLDLAGIFPTGFSLIPNAQSSSQVILFNGLLVLDAFYYFFASVFLIVSIVVVIASLTYIKSEEPHQGEYYALLLFSTLGMMIVALAGDFIILFLGLELSTLSTFALVAFRKRVKLGSEASMKFFIIGALSSALLLYGISLIFGITGTTNFSELAGIIPERSSFTPTLVVASVLILAGLGFKMSAVPFHMWVPDTFQGAPTTVTTFLAAASKKMGFAAAFIVFAVALVALHQYWGMLVFALAIFTMTVGNVGALMQTSVKRLLAYSSIAQAGYILIALAVASPTAIAGGLYYMLAHALMKGGAFIVVAIAIHTMIGDRIEDYTALRKRAPLLAFAMAIFLFSLAGIPPLGGFWAKFLVFSGAIESGGIFVWLAVAGILNSALSVYYYARIIKQMYVLPPSSGILQRIKMPPMLTVALLLTLVGTILIGLLADPIVNYTQVASAALFQRI